MKKSSKFAELSEIHNTDSSNKALPPFAFSEDQQESVDVVEKVEVSQLFKKSLHYGFSGCASNNNYDKTNYITFYNSIYNH